MISANNFSIAEKDLIDFYNGSLSTYTKALFAIKRFNVDIVLKTEVEITEQFISCMEFIELFSAYTIHIMSKNSCPEMAKPSINAFIELTKQLDFMINKSNINENLKAKLLDALINNYIPDL